MLFGKKRVIAYLEKTTLGIYSPDEGLDDSVTFPKDAVIEKEVIQEDKLKEAVLGLLVKSDFKKPSVVLLIAEDLLFQKTLIQEGKTAPKEEIEKYFDTIRFDQKKLAKNVYRFENQYQLVATNREFYQTVMSVLESEGWQVEAVLPITLFPGIPENKTLTKDEVVRILGKRKVLEIGNFLGEDMPIEQKEEQVEEEPQQVVGHASRLSKRKKGPGKGFFLLLFVIALIAGSVTLFALGIVKRPTTQPVNEVSMENPPTQTPTPTMEPIAKADLSIQVLNGTGTVGQAGQVKAALEDIEYVNVETGNADETDMTETTIVYSDRVSQEQLDEIKRILEKLFASVTTEKASADPEFDIVITTGGEPFES